jgi:hypothetical protein
LVRASYDQLGLRTYFTSGPTETRAWTIKGGWTAPQVYYTSTTVATALLTGLMSIMPVSEHLLLNTAEPLIYIIIVVVAVI